MTPKSPLKTGALVVLFAAALGACGKLGPLEQPAPLIGEKAKADFARKKADEAAAKAARQKAAQTPATVPNAAADQPDDPAKPLDNAPKTTRDVQDPNQKLTRLRDTPVDGSPNPFGGSVSLTPPN